MTDTDDLLRDRLLAGSDHRACRAAWEQVNDGPSADVTDLVETMRVTGGDVALVARDGAADVYARWSDGRFEHLTVWPPWTIGGYDHTDRQALEAFLAGKAPRPVPYEETPFASPETLASMAGRIWP